MTIHVNIGDAKTQLSKLIAAALRGERVILDKAGEPQVILVPFDSTLDNDIDAARKRIANIGKYSSAASENDMSLSELKKKRFDWKERFERKFGSDS